MDERTNKIYTLTYDSPAVIKEIKLGKGKYCTVNRTGPNVFVYTFYCGSGTYPVTILDGNVRPAEPFEVDGMRREVHLLRVAGGDVNKILLEYLGIKWRLKKKGSSRERKRHNWMR